MRHIFWMSVWVVFGGCLGPVVATIIDDETDEADEPSSSDEIACRKSDDFNLLWHPNLELEVNPLHTFLVPTKKETWILTFGSQVWVPLYAGEPQTACFYTDEPQAIQKLFRADTSGEYPLVADNYTELDLPVFEELSDCDAPVYKTCLEMDGGVYFWEANGSLVPDDMWAMLLRAE